MAIMLEMGKLEIKKEKKEKIKTKKILKVKNQLKKL